MKWLKREMFVTGLMAAVIVVFLALFYLDYTRTEGIGNREVIGYIQFKHNRIQRKFFGRGIWSNLLNRSALTNRDTIRSDNLSDAQIHLKDKTVIRIDENSMFYLDLSGKNPRLQFESGSIQVDQKQGGKLSIRSGGKQIDLQGSGLKLEGQSGRVAMTVNRGQAAVLVGGRRHRVGLHQKASLGGRGVRVTQVNMVLLEPENQRVVAATGRSVRLPFRWRLRKRFRNVVFEVSRYRNFARLSLQRPAGRHGAVAELRPGRYYWRLRTSSASGREFSEVRKLVIVHNAAVYQYSPANKFEHSFVLSPPMVHFRWSPNGLAAGYRLEVSGSPSFGAGTRRIAVRSASYSLAGLEPGTYYWRVFTRPGLSTVAVRRSRVRSFRVVKKEHLDVPEPTSPRIGWQVSQTHSQSRGVFFSWQAPAEVSSYLLQVSADPRFRSVVYESKVERNFVRLRTLKNLGTYYWRVKGRAVAQGGKQSRYSSISRFVVKRKVDVRRERFYGFAALAPVNTRVSISGKDFINLRWRRADGASGYDVQLFRGSVAPGNSVVRRRGVQGGEFRVPTRVLRPGPYVWTVKPNYPRTTRGRTLTSRFSVAAQNIVRKERPYHEYSLAEYLAHIRGLARSCGARRLPDLVINRCEGFFVTMDFSNREKTDLYNFIRLLSGNVFERASGYGYFRERCQPHFRPALEQMQLKQGHWLTTLDERQRIARAIEAMRACH